MTTEQFDPHAFIRALAEAEWPRVSLPDFPGDPPGSVGTQSMEVPFASLRTLSIYMPKWAWLPEPDAEKAAWRVHVAYPHTCYATTIEEELRVAEAWLREKSYDRSTERLP